MVASIQNVNAPVKKVDGYYFFITDRGISRALKAMWHTVVVAPMVMNRFP